MNTRTESKDDVPSLHANVDWKGVGFATIAFVVYLALWFTVRHLIGAKPISEMRESDSDVEPAVMGVSALVVAVGAYIFAVWKRNPLKIIVKRAPFVLLALIAFAVGWRVTSGKWPW